MNLNDFYLSPEDKKNIQKWLETFDKPLFISGKTGIGKTKLANIILKDYTQIVVDPHLTTNISEFIDKSINETDISMMFSKKKYKSIVLDNISYTDRIIIKELKNISLKKYKNPIVIIANNINNKQIQHIKIFTLFSNWNISLGFYTQFWYTRNYCRSVAGHDNTP